jgi:hypothetical protein
MQITSTHNREPRFRLTKKERRDMDATEGLLSTLAAFPCPVGRVAAETIALLKSVAHQLDGEPPVTQGQVGLDRATKEDAR